VAELDAPPWADESMDAVLASAVLHFATDEQHFGRMLDELWRVLALL
jgi:tellurite methyltransferase